MWWIIILIIGGVILYFLFRSPSSDSGNSVIQSTFENMNKKLFPNGERDKQEGADELLWILNNGVSKEEALNIFIRASAISVLSEKFDKERLRAHLDGKCKGVFNEQQVTLFYSYLTSRLLALSMGSKVRRVEGEGYTC